MRKYINGHHLRILNPTSFFSFFISCNLLHIYRFHYASLSKGTESGSFTAVLPAPRSVPGGTEIRSYLFSFNDLVRQFSGKPRRGVAFGLQTKPGKRATHSNLKQRTAPRSGAPTRPKSGQCYSPFGQPESPNGLPAVLPRKP